MFLNTNNAFHTADTPVTEAEPHKPKSTESLSEDGQRSQYATFFPSLRTLSQTLKLDHSMLRDATLPMLQYKEPFKVEEEPSELTVESVPTFLPTATLNSSSLRRQKRSRRPLKKRTRLDSQRNKLPDKDLPLENEQFLPSDFLH